MIPYFKSDGDVIRTQSWQTVLDQLRENTRTNFVNNEAVQLNPDRVRLPIGPGKSPTHRRGFKQFEFLKEQVCHSNINEIRWTRIFIANIKSSIKIAAYNPR